jgi:hypothetical protein
MEPEEEKYDALVKLLRRSKPETESTNDIEEKVIYRIRQKAEKKNRSSHLLDYLFGWVYIEWVRKSLLAASALIVVFFVYQQSIILKRLNDLSSQPVINDSRIMTGLSNTPEGKLFFYKLTGRKIKANYNAISDRQIEEFLKSVNDLQVKYKDLIRLINEDPDLRKEIEKRMSESHRKKLKL